MRVHHSRRARDDLLEIWLRVAAENPAAADRLYDRFETRIAQLERYPEIGVARPDIAPEARMLVVRPYLVLYRLIRGGSEVVRVVHGARRLDSELFDEGLR
jgi:toxin ParE1/3/4